MPALSFSLILAKSLATSLARDLVRASARAVRRRLSAGKAKKALEAALTEALAESLELLSLDPLHRGHYQGLFETFLARERVVDELTLLLDPRPGSMPDMRVLEAEFAAAGFDADLLPHFELASFLRSFLAAFYAAASRDEHLRAVIEIRLLGELVSGIGVVASSTTRTAAAGERTAVATESLVGEVRAMKQALDNLLQGLPGQPLLGAVEELGRRSLPAAQEGYEALIAGLLDAGFEVGLEASEGGVELTPRRQRHEGEMTGPQVETLRRATEAPRQALL